MADFDNMSAAELRSKLAEYGLPVMPITASTRNILVKKLKLAMENREDAKTVDGRRSLAKYSSGEDSDMDIGRVTKEKAKNRRATVGGAMLPPTTSKLKKPPPPKKSDSPAKIDNDKDSEPESEPIKTHEEIKTVTTRRITRTFKPSVEQEEYETGSDSDVDNKSSTSHKNSSYTPTISPPYKSVSRDYSISSTLPAASLTRDSIIKPTIPSYPSYSSSSDLNSIRSRLGLTQNYGERPSLSTTNYSSYSTYKPTTTTTTTEEIDSPYLSSFTRRLSALKATELKNDTKDTNNSGSSNNGSSSYVKSYYKPSFKLPQDHSPDFKAAGEKNVFKNNLVSLTIVGVGLIFFLGVSFLYLGMKSDVLLLEDANDVIPICDNNYDAKLMENCLTEDGAKNAKGLLKAIYPELNRRAVTAKCEGKENHFHMKDLDIVEFAKKISNRSGPLIWEDLYNLQILVSSNPKWGISILSVDPYNKIEKLTDLQQVVLKRHKKETALAILDPSIPWKCSISHLLYYGGHLFFWFVFVGVVLFSIQWLVKFYMLRTKKRKDEVYSLVEQIIDVLSQDNAEEGAEPAGQAMAISHVRDMLILPQNREKKTDIWNDAIKFLEKNESRVRFEVNRVAGEEYKTIRWVSPQGSPRARGPGARAWQGQAFETQEGSVNNLTISPTPCLKIRHMVEKNDMNPNLKTVITDVILEKCQSKCKILHIDIDKVSCCVYVKCATPADAGIVYQNLHGWWYEGNLITVKYLRLERYMDHFPNSPSTGPYLRLSSKSN